jgi:tryptophan-rich sensory protein
MLNTFNSPKLNGAIVNVVASIASVLLINAAIFGLRWSSINSVQLLDSTVLPALTPPVYAIGMVWTLLFGLMGTSRWLLNKVQNSQRTNHQQLVVFLILFCLAHPLYSLAIDSRLGALIGNLGTILLATFTYLKISHSSRQAALLVLPTIVWITYATVILVAVIQARGW